jgi:hypothetical protein
MQASAAPAPTSFTSLPPALQHAILRRLPVDARARCAAVCRGWRTAVSDVSLWTRLDLSRSSGVTCAVNDAALRGAARLARGCLTALDVSGRHDVTDWALLPVITVIAGALTELRACYGGAESALPYAVVEALSRAAPLLRVLDADVRCESGEEASRLLRNEPPFGPLRVHSLQMSCRRLALAEREAAVTASLAEDFGAHDSLSSLELTHVRFDTPGVLDAVVDAALLRRMHTLELSDCELSPPAVPALARLLGGSSLTELRIPNGTLQLLDVPAAALLANALRANTTLTCLHLGSACLWDDDAAAITLWGL